MAKSATTDTRGNEMAELHGPQPRDPYYGYYRKEWVDLCEDLKDRDKAVYGVLRALVYETRYERNNVRRLSLLDLCELIPGVNGKKTTVGGLRDCLRRLTAVGLVSEPCGPGYRDDRPLTTSASRTGVSKSLRIRIHDMPWNDYTPTWANVQEKLTAIRASREAQEPPNPPPAEAVDTSPEAPQDPGCDSNHPPSPKPTGCDPNQVGWRPNQVGWDANFDTRGDQAKRGPISCSQSSSSSSSSPSTPEAHPTPSPEPGPEEREEEISPRQNTRGPSQTERALQLVCERTGATPQEAEQVLSLIAQRRSQKGVPPVVQWGTFISGRPQDMLETELAQVRAQAQEESDRAFREDLKGRSCEDHGVQLPCQTCRIMAKDPDDRALVYELYQRVGPRARPDLARIFDPTP